MKNLTAKLAQILLLACLPIAAWAVTPAEELKLTKLGEAKLSWFGLSIYTASLWSSPDTTLTELYGNPVVLSLNYHRNVSKDRILQSTSDEWERLDGRLDEQEVSWIKSLAEIFPDIQKGDQLSSLTVPGQETRFYLGNREIGRISDAGFGPAFLAIWLDPNTRSKPIRGKLLEKLLQASEDSAVGTGSIASL